jgi:hypothetical protein
LAALEAARSMPHGLERTEAMRTEAMKKAGILRSAAGPLGVFFAKRGAESGHKTLGALTEAGRVRVRALFDAWCLTRILFKYTSV